MFYTGHGNQDKGGWLVYTDWASGDPSDELIVFEDLWEIIVKSGFTGGVEITSDSCYSGRVV